jgi:hypothetical protein
MILPKLQSYTLFCSTTSAVVRCSSSCTYETVTILLLSIVVLFSALTAPDRLQQDYITILLLQVCHNSTLSELPAAALFYSVQLPA